MARRRPRPVRVLLPGEREGRRGFLKKGLFGAVLLAAAGGGTWLATRRTRVDPALKPLLVFDAAQLTVLLAIANRMVPEHPGFPRPAEVGLPARIDAIAAMAHPSAQKELRQLVTLFESGLSGVLDLSPRLFTECDGPAQEKRLRQWQNSRLSLRRTGFRALKRLVAAAYYSSPETWGAVGYPGPPNSPTLAPRPQPAPETRPAEPGEGAPPPRPRPFRPAPVPVEPVVPQILPAGPGGDGGG
ncbi:MAG: gluconate 2-dehydrogenase subunit 3 family protein [Deltaproteobacteria bacterium]|nr:gluconate 2-dehydrogenase subunit 3 family protein [Deltaproteobacteria bacterium]